MPPGASNRGPLSYLPFALPLLGLLGGVVFGASSISEPPTDLTFLAVGQGDCSVFRHQGLTVLIDAGPETAARIVAPALRKMGVRRVDLLLVSHPDLDHIGGLSALAKKYNIGQVIIPGSFKGHPDMIEGLQNANIPSDRVKWLDGPWSLALGQFRLHLDSIPWMSGSSDNDGSMCVQLTDGKASATLSGDAGEFAEDQLSPLWDWKAEVMHVGHHGSATSSSYGWLREVSPEVAVVSCGRMNPYGHPAPTAMERMKVLGIPVLRTDQDGTITFRATEKGFELERK